MQSDISEGHQALLMKMGYERCENYLSSARAILYLYQDEKYPEKEPFENLWHLTDLMSIEIDRLNVLLSSHEDNNGLNRIDDIN